MLPDEQSYGLGTQRKSRAIMSYFGRFWVKEPRRSKKKKRSKSATYHCRGTRQQHGNACLHCCTLMLLTGALIMELVGVRGSRRMLTLTNMQILRDCHNLRGDCQNMFRHPSLRTFNDSLSFATSLSPYICAVKSVGKWLPGTVQVLECSQSFLAVS